MNDTSCASRDSCLSCAAGDGCGWCDKGPVVPDFCFSTETGSCPDDFIVEEGKCPAVVGVSVALLNLLLLLVSVVCVALFLRVFNRALNRRRNRKLQKSIFTLPVYVFNASSRKRAVPARTASPHDQGSSEPPEDVEVAGSAGPPSSPGPVSSAQNDDDVSTYTCAICISPFVEEEVIKVLPCGHEFHAGCLDSWLAVRPMCPLCKKPAFSKSRGPDRLSRSQTQGEGNSPAGAASRLALSLSSDSLHEPQPGGDGERESGGEAGRGLLSARTPSPPPAPAPAPSPPEGSVPAELTGVEDSRYRGAAQTKREPVAAGGEGTAGVVPAISRGMEGAEEARVARRVRSGSGAQQGTRMASSIVTGGLDSPSISSRRGEERGLKGGGFHPKPRSPCHGGSASGLALGVAGGARDVSLNELERGRSGAPNADVVLDVEVS